ncbi:unnamed protein product [Triticum turgidum subsp. durum]|uniref:Squalene cyclase N-terminal domain-containing protein n=1 Tax=Triticum turgidum subsp. durum TaxID=4567 RepID=A0A9R1Q7Z1_TRITD|nr:unnamed protein product [Triticum turgidum subsp. durum]
MLTMRTDSGDQKRNMDGGWGIHTEGGSSMLRSALNYTALRLLGENVDDEQDMSVPKTRKWLHDHGGAMMIKLEARCLDFLTSQECSRICESCCTTINTNAETLILAEGDDGRYICIMALLQQTKAWWPSTLLPESLKTAYFLTPFKPELRLTEPDENGIHSGRDAVLWQFEVHGVNEEKDYELCVENTQYCYAKKAR